MVAYHPGNLWRRLVLRADLVADHLQQRLVKTGAFDKACQLPAASFGSMVRNIAALPLPVG